jgi:hypothetical protein
MFSFKEEKKIPNFIHKAPKKKNSVAGLHWPKK